VYFFWQNLREKYRFIRNRTHFGKNKVWDSLLASDGQEQLPLPCVCRASLGAVLEINEKATLIRVALILSGSG